MNKLNKGHARSEDKTISPSSFLFWSRQPPPPPSAFLSPSWVSLSSPAWIMHILVSVTQHNTYPLLTCPGLDSSPSLALLRPSPASSWCRGRWSPCLRSSWRPPSPHSSSHRQCSAHLCHKNKVRGNNDKSVNKYLKIKIQQITNKI